MAVPLAPSGGSGYGLPMSFDLIALDIGGTNARFCRAGILDGQRPALGTVRKYRVADYPGLAEAWRAFEQDEAEPLPPRASIAIAAPVRSGPIKFTNSHWVIDPASIGDELGIGRLALVNDFEAMAYGVTALSRDRLDPLFGPDTGLPNEGVVTIVGPGTGLGVAMAALTDGRPRIFATEGGHVGFAPSDDEDERILHGLREMFGRVSAERVVSGPGLNLLYQLIGKRDDIGLLPLDDGEVWRRALAEDPESAAEEALTRLCMNYGSVAGDLALAHGAACVVLAGGLTGRMKDHAAFASFHPRFVDKGRYRDFMSRLPVYHADHPEMGLLGAAVAGQVLLA